MIYKVCDWFKKLPIFLRTMAPTPPTYADLREQYQSEFGHSSIAMVEPLDLFILEHFCTSIYQPSEHPQAMSVGPFSVREGTVLRAFHKHMYGRQVKVAGCNNFTPARRLSVQNDLDVALFDPLFGDATYSHTWMTPCADGDFPDVQFDMSYIRNPDLVNMQKWAAVFAKAYEFTKPKGIVVTLVRKNDVDKYKELERAVKHEYDMTPIISTPTGIEKLSGVNRDIAELCHYLGVFKREPTVSDVEQRDAA